MDLTTKEYYGFKDEARNDWDTFWNSYYSSLHKYTDIPCNKCDIAKLKTISEHLEGLTFNMVHDFLCTFDTSCANNVEYSEWSNELLFKVLDKSPTIYFEVIASGHVNNDLILEEVKSPLHDFNLQSIYDKIKAVSGVTAIKTKYLDAIVFAAKNGGQEIKR